MINELSMNTQFMSRQLFEMAIKNSITTSHHQCASKQTTSESLEYSIKPTPPKSFLKYFSF